MQKVIDRLLNSEEERVLSYSQKGTPIVWDFPFYGNREEVKAAIALLEDPEVIAALKEGLKLPKARFFIWVCRDGEIDYGVLQGDYFLTLWVPGAKKLKSIDEAKEKVLSLAQEKFARERRNKEEALQDAVNPWLFKEREERIQNLKFLKENLHPLWTDLHERVEALLKEEYPTCPWCGKKHPSQEHHQCAPDAHLEAAYEERFEME